MKSERFFQYTLILLGLITTALFGVFFFRELYPEYRIYQDDFIILEKFRSELTHEPPSPFKVGVKQIVIEQENKGPPTIDRCISCHVALQVEAYSPTRIAKNINGEIVYDAFGVPEKEPNPDYIWKKLEETIATTENPKLKAQYESLKTATVEDQVYSVEKALQMHPLMGRETRPFEFHPMEEYGCTSCHGGNGRGLVTDRAHGPVFDGQYEQEYRGYVPKFLESDLKNDPKFAEVFNAKPGHRLLFQTSPIYVGALIQAKCMNCHQSSNEIVQGATNSATSLFSKKSKEIEQIKKALDSEEEALSSLYTLKKMLAEKGYELTTQTIDHLSNDYTLPSQELEDYASQLKFLKKYPKEQSTQEIDKALLKSLGNLEIVNQFDHAFDPKQPLESIQKAMQAIPLQSNLKGTLFAKVASLQAFQALDLHIKDLSHSFDETSQDLNAVGKIQTDVDLLTKEYQRGEELFLTQACYACHRISGFARGGVGPELSRSGDSYPWYIKESIVWPQADLKTSTMPNLRLDHEELEPLLTYLLGQTSQKKALSDTEYKIAIQQWESGKKREWELPIESKKIQNIDYGLEVFAVEGCASCHRLRGYTSDVGFTVEKMTNESFADLEKEREWFEDLIPETLTGSQLVQLIEKNHEIIDANLSDNVREGSILEKIESKHPHIIESFYSSFKFALRAKNQESPQVIKEWKARVRKVLKMYVQIYGLGRLICPKPNWSGVYRSDEWLMEHFKNPSSHVARSIMPAFPFDDTKFYALTYTLDQIAQKNVAIDRKSSEINGFNPEKAYQLYCSQCHGSLLEGDGPVAVWLYPPPKNLRRAEFLRNLTKERAVQSVIHGVKGTPMPPWGEIGNDKLSQVRAPVMTEKEVRELVNWIFSKLPGETIIPTDQEVQKWKYEPDDIIRELQQENGYLQAIKKESGEMHLFASLEPPTQPSKQILEIFDEIPNVGIGPEKNAFFIKQRYFTQENIESGRRLFIENCATCHGKEADGAGLRAEAMYDAKPRMLTNFDWINTRDDLRLLRSIKYGVQGTSMTPWGDQTNGLQRLQLVIFIRSLTEDKKRRNEITEAIYQVFDRSEYLLEASPVSNENLKAIVSLLRKQKDIFYTLSSELLNLDVNEDILDTFQAVILSNENLLQVDKEKLVFDDSDHFQKIFNEKKQKLLEAIDFKLSEITKEKLNLEGKINAQERSLALNQLNAAEAGWKKMKARLISGLAEYLRRLGQEKELINQGL